MLLRMLSSLSRAKAQIKRFLIPGIYIRNFTIALFKPPLEMKRK